MIRVAVSKDEKINPRNLFPNTLQAELRRRINLNMQPIHHDVNTRTPPLITRICRGADRTITSNHRNALRSTRAEKNNFHEVILRAPQRMTREKCLEEK